MTVASQLKTCYASIKSIEASLKILRAQTNEKEAQTAFLHTEKLMQEVKQDLEKQVLMLAREEPQYNQ